MSARTRPALQPVLSILIPAYNYAVGVLRIVVPLLAEGRSDIEILIYDDSSDDGVGVAVRDAVGPHPCLRYVRNSPTLGAVPNWNKLLQSARGRYEILIHHDDFPLSASFASDLLGELEKQDWPDALILTCVPYDVVHRKTKPSICNFFRLFIGRRYPAYLFKRNVMGPPSVFVVRRDLFEGYDPALTWLVDVEAYFRFLTAQTRRLVSSRLIIISSTGLPNSITSSIESEVRKVTKSELAYIASRYPQRSCWSSPQGETLQGKFLLTLELPVWLVFRIAAVICSALRGGASLSAAVNQRYSD